MTNSLTEEIVRSRLQGVMLQAKRLGVQQVQAGSRFERGFSVNARDGKKESVSYHEQVAARVTVYQDSRSGSAFTTDMSESGLQAALEKAVSLASFSEPDSAGGLPEEDDLAMTYPDCDLYHPWVLTPEEAAHSAIDLEQRALSLDKRCVVGDGASVSTYDTTSCLMNSMGFSGSYRRTDHSAGVSMLAKDKGEMQSDYAYTSSRLPTGLRNNDHLAAEVVRKVVGRLGAKALSSREVPVIFSPEVAIGFWGHLFSALSGRLLYRQKSFLCDQLGQQILRSGFTLKQQPHALCQAGSLPYDSNGSITREVSFVEDGIFKVPMTSAYSARQLGALNTGNASGVHHCVIPDDGLSCEQMCQQMGEGFLVMDVMGQGVDLLTGDYSRGASGYWVSGGEIQYPVQGVTIASSLPKMLLGIQSLGADRETRSRVHAGSVWFDRMIVGGSDS